jgi:hypothetical protein
MKRHAAPILAAVLLLLPVLYVGSYLVMVAPRSCFPNGRAITTEIGQLDAWPEDYRVAPRTCEILFWPLEQIDRKVRPGAWEVWHTNPDGHA